VNNRLWLEVSGKCWKEISKNQQGKSFRWKLFASLWISIGIFLLWFFVFPIFHPHDSFILRDVVWHLGLACAPLLQKENIGGAQALESQVEEDRMLVRTAIFFHNVITTKVLER